MTNFLFSRVFKLYIKRIVPNEEWLLSPDKNNWLALHELIIGIALRQTFTASYRHIRLKGPKEMWLQRTFFFSLTKRWKRRRTWFDFNSGPRSFQIKKIPFNDYCVQMSKVMGDYARLWMIMQHQARACKRINRVPKLGGLKQNLAKIFLDYEFAKVLEACLSCLDSISNTPFFMWWRSANVIYKRLSPAATNKNI